MNVKITQGDKTVSTEVKTGEDMKQTGEQITFEELLAPKSLAPGRYKLDIETTDHVNNQKISRSTEFTVIPPANNNAAANGAAGR